MTSKANPLGLEFLGQCLMNSGRTTMSRFLLWPAKVRILTWLFCLSSWGTGPKTLVPMGWPCLSSNLTWDKKLLDFISCDVNEPDKLLFLNPPSKERPTSLIFNTWNQSKANYCSMKKSAHQYGKIYISWQ